MFTRLKIALTIVLGLVWVLVVRFALFLCNKPSDLALYGGILILLASVVVLPSTFKRILHPRKKKVNEPTDPNPPAVSAAA